MSHIVHRNAVSAAKVLWSERRLLLCGSPMSAKRWAVFSLFVGVVSIFGQAPPTTLQTDLQSHGWKTDRGVLHGSWLPNTIDFADDDSLWVAFPTEASKALPSRDASYTGKVLHIASSGEVVAECNTGALQWSSLRLFAQRADGFTLDTTDKLISYDARCKQRSMYPTDDRTAVTPSPNRALIFTRMRDNHVHVLNGDSLEVTRELYLPKSVHRNQVLFGDRLIMYPVTIPTRGCWQSQFSRMEVFASKSDPWVTIACARFNLLGDEHIVYSNAGGDAPLRIIGGTESGDAAYDPPQDAHIDLSVLNGFPVESPASLRIVEELIESKGRHSSLDMSGKFVGRDIVLLDMHTGTALLTIKVTMDSLTYSYALSRDGKKFAVLLNSQLTVYRVP